VGRFDRSSNPKADEKGEEKREEKKRQTHGDLLGIHIACSLE
jgi:hypothetical protein